MKQAVISLAVAMVIVLAVGGCGRDLPSNWNQDVPGLYEGRQAAFSEVIEFKADGTFFRENRIGEPDALAWLNVLDSYQITTAPIWPLGNGAVWMLARQVNISAYDAGYLYLAKTRGLKLATVDGPLVNKAAKAGVSLLFRR